MSSNSLNDTRSSNYKGDYNSASGVYPNSLLPQTLDQPILTTKQIRSVFSQNSSVGPNSSFIISIPQTSQDWLVGGSCYLSFNAVFTGATSGSFGFKNNNVASLIQRVTISLGGSIAETMNNYGLTYSGLYMPLMASPGELNASVITSGAVAGENNYVPLTYTNSTNGGTQYTTINVNSAYAFGQFASTPQTYCLPLLSGILNSSQSDQYFPLWALNQPLQIQFDTASVIQSFVGSAAAGCPTSYNISSIQLVYETISPDSSYTNRIKSEMAAGKSFSFPYQTFTSVSTAASPATNFLQGLISSSLDSYFWANQTALAAANIGYGDFSATSLTQAADITNVQRRMLFINGQSISSNSSFATTDASMLSELIRAIGGVINASSVNFKWSNIGNASSTNYGSFRSSYYICGYNLRSYNQSNLINCGTPCSSVNLQVIDNSSMAPNTTLFMWSITSQILSIKGDGSVVITR